MELNRRRKKLARNSAQNKLLLFIFAAAVIPAGIAIVCLYYLIFNLLAWQIGIPEAIAYNLIPVARRVTLTVIIAVPIVLAVIWILALELSHRLVGPLCRLERELDERIAGGKRNPIQVRKKDVLGPLVEKINKLMAS